MTSEEFNSIEIIEYLRGKNGISLEDYERLYRMKEFSAAFEAMFRCKYLYRELLLSRSILATKKDHMKKLYVFEEAFRSQSFKKINYWRKSLSSIYQFRCKYSYINISSTSYINHTLIAFLRIEHCGELRPFHPALQRWQRLIFHWFIASCSRCSNRLCSPYPPFSRVLSAQGRWFLQAHSKRYESDYQTHLSSIFCTSHTHAFCRDIRPKCYLLKNRLDN